MTAMLTHVAIAEIKCPKQYLSVRDAQSRAMFAATSVSHNFHSECIIRKAQVYCLTYKPVLSGFCVVHIFGHR